MNFKKIAITSAAAGVLLASAMPAFAYGGSHHNNSNSGTDIDNNATVNNNVLTVSNTGANVVTGNLSLGAQGGRGHHYKKNNEKGPKLTTGDAGAVTVVKNNVNSNDVSSSCGCDEGSRRHKKSSKSGLDIDNDAAVTNNVATVSNTGMNYVSGNGAEVTTGDAGSKSVVKNTVNTNTVSN